LEEENGNKKSGGGGGEGSRSFNQRAPVAVEAGRVIKAR